ncbi:hypothetical protein [Tenacibaculum finnmarkense]|uniref:TIGR04255 family protein n=1 Tax=Tenacibaculum finnmarkense genomovar finnmarkense TaxID=1458503 RepID=A0AAP1WHD5_9FLAO|nr:hypothetical protein [Tenacibaculum finnmarkense]MBE7653933.1 hypothetical protein [Tenacibaculum finnmarkense genomovar finnmarkense]MBE7696292.1 hypothetical protein [Tenacibaculum finnmarkense genomovar finnmarkense]MCD8428518.1 hypothetical protein [Tenacibaculum finnmarkense genomovar finnmarkense]SOS50850.1 conserved hypothetical protein [Tenacibaculum finnmarkense]
MNIVNLKYQVIAFGNYNDVIPSAENMKFFLENFSDKGLIPNQVQEINVNVGNGDLKNETITRLALTSQDKSWNILFNNQRLEISLTNVAFKSDELFTLEFFIKETSQILEKISEKFTKKHNRIGFTTQTLVDKLDNKTTYKKLNTPLPYFSEELPIQWSNKFAFRKIIKIPNPEIINISSDFSWIKAKIGQNNKSVDFEGILANIDINTLSENNDNRFNITEIRDFISNANSIEKEIKNQFLETITK